MSNLLKVAKQARRGLKKVHSELIDPSPESVERCAVPLQVAIACMTELARQVSNPASISGGEQGLRAELAGLQSDLVKAKALLESAGSFYQGYGRLLQAAAPECVEDYSPAARLASLRSERNFVVHG